MSSVIDPLATATLRTELSPGTHSALVHYESETERDATPIAAGLPSSPVKGAMAAALTTPRTKHAAQDRARRLFDEPMFLLNTSGYSAAEIYGVVGEETGPAPSPASEMVESPTPPQRRSPSDTPAAGIQASMHNPHVHWDEQAVPSSQPDDPPPPAATGARHVSTPYPRSAKPRDDPPNHSPLSLDPPSVLRRSTDAPDRKRQRLDASPDLPPLPGIEMHARLPDGTPALADTPPDWLMDALHSPAPQQPMLPHEQPAPMDDVRTSQSDVDDEGLRFLAQGPLSDPFAAYDEDFQLMKTVTRQGNTSKEVIQLPPHTPRPMNGFPQVHSDQLLHLFENQEEEQILNWRLIQGPKLLVQVYGYAATGPLVPHLKQAISWAVRDFASDESVSVAAPRAKSGSTLPRDQPRTFLVYGLAERAHRKLLYQECLSILTVTIIMRDFCPTVPRFVGGFRGLDVDPNPDATNDVVLRELGRKINSTTTRDLIANLSRDDPVLSTRSAEEAVLLVLQSIHITVLPTRGRMGVLDPTVNLYIHPPCTKRSGYRVWQDYMSSLDLNHAGGQPISRAPPYHCDGCHACDHPRGLCPFPLLPGWRGPPATANNPRAPQRPNISIYSREFLSALAPPPQQPPPGPDRAGPSTRGRLNRGNGRGSGRGPSGFSGRGGRYNPRDAMPTPTPTHPSITPAPRFFPMSFASTPNASIDDTESF